MYLNWKQRLNVQPTLLDINMWPQIDIKTITPKKQRIFTRNRKIVALALKMTPLVIIGKTVNLNPSRITQILNRCLAGYEQEDPALTKALVPGIRITKSARRSPLASLSSPKGSNYSFTYLLENVEGLENHLRTLLKPLKNMSKNGQNITVQFFHKALLRYLKDQHWPQDCYPFDHDSQAYEATRTFFHKSLLDQQSPSKGKKEIISKKHSKQIFEHIEIDEHTVDCRGSVIIEIDKKFEPLAITRLTLIAARDVASMAILAIHIVPGNVSQYEILSFLNQLSSRWERLKLVTPGLSYPPGNFMPTEIRGDFLRPTFGTFHLDNAKAHIAHRIKDYICNRLGSTVNLGYPAYPVARVIIESVFKNLNLTIHRFASTTGSHPTDCIKEPARLQKEAPLITLSVIEEAIHVHVANLNRKPLPCNANNSPMEFMKYQMEHLFIPLQPQYSLQKDNAFTQYKTVKVRIVKGAYNRARINFAYVQYANPEVLTPSFGGDSIVIKFDIRDIREVKAYRVTGELIGTLRCPKSWYRFKHSLSIRLRIFQLSKKYNFKLDDPFANTFEYLRTHRNIPTNASDLISLSRGVILDDKEHNSSDEENKSSSKGTVIGKIKHSENMNRKLPDWSASMLAQRIQD